jgi:hypothetical protein
MSSQRSLYDNITPCSSKAKHSNTPLSPLMPLTIDHTAIVVPAAKLDNVIKFLLAALEPLGLREMMRPIPTSVGLGDQTPFFWVTGIEGDAKTLELVMQNEHTAFSAHGRWR